MKTEKQNTNNWVANRIDDLVGVFSPIAAAKRKYFRFIAQTMFGSYQGALGGRLRGSWIASSGSADEDLLRDIAKLRERSRDLIRNDGIASGAMDTIITNIIGSGISPQSRIDKEILKINEDYADKLQKQFEKIWQRWVPYADAANRLNFYEIEELSERSRFTNGESIIVPLRIPAAKRKRPYSIALQSVEADRLATPSDLYSNRKIRYGVEIGEYGEPVAYYIRNTHPGDYFYSKSFDNSSQNYIRYPALNDLGDPNIFHLYHLKRSGQTRGEPFFTPVITLFQDRNKYMEAEIMAARVAACFAAFVKKEMANEYAMGQSEKDEEGKQLESIEPALIQYLEPGEDVSFANPNRPGNNFGIFMERILRDISSGLNLPYEILSKDFSKSNYSNTRAALLEARRFFMMQQRFIADRLGKPVFFALIEEAYLLGELPILDFYQNREAYVRSRWIAPGWQWIDPQNEVTAAADSVNNNFSTLAEEAADRGQDYEEILEQRAREQKKIKELEAKYGIKLTPQQPPIIKQQLPGKKQPGDTAPGDQPAGPDAQQPGEPAPGDQPAGGNQNE